MGTETLGYEVMSSEVMVLGYIEPPLDPLDVVEPSDSL